MCGGILMLDEVLYDTTRTCICCKKEFETKRMKTSKIRTKKKDVDGCPHYTSENPLFYEFNICPHCGVVFTDSMKPANTVQKQNLINAFIKNTPISKSERDVHDALRLSKLALVTAAHLETPSHIVSNICLRIAWFDRYLKNEEEEKRFLAYAAGEFEKSFSSGAENMPETYIVHLLGELYHLLGDNERTKQWFNILFRSDPKDPYVKKGKDRWFDIKKEIEARVQEVL